MIVLAIPYPSAVAPALNPSAVFAAGEAGAWYDPADGSTLWQDAAGTIAVTAAGQAVGRVNDKSGNGNHLIQTANSLQPSYQVDSSGNAYLLFDGVDDNLSFASSPLTAYPFDRVSALRQVTWASSSRIYSNGTGVLLVMRPPFPGFEINDGTGGVVNCAGPPVGTTGIVTERHAAGAAKLSINSGAYVSGNAGSNVPAAPFVIGARDTAGTWPANIRLYGCVMRAGTMSDDEIAGIRSWLASRSGVAL